MTGDRFPVLGMNALEPEAVVLKERARGPSVHAFGGAVHIQHLAVDRRGPDHVVDRRQELLEAVFAFAEGAFPLLDGVEHVFEFACQLSDFVVASGARRRGGLLSVCYGDSVPRELRERADDAEMEPDVRHRHEQDAREQEGLHGVVHGDAPLGRHVAQGLRVNEQRPIALDVIECAVAVHEIGVVCFEDDRLRTGEAIEHAALFRGGGVSTHGRDVERNTRSLGEDPREAPVEETPHDHGASARPRVETRENGPGSHQHRPLGGQKETGDGGLGKGAFARFTRQQWMGTGQGVGGEFRDLDGFAGRRVQDLAPHDLSVVVADIDEVDSCVRKRGVGKICLDVVRVSIPGERIRVVPRSPVATEVVEMLDLAVERLDTTRQILGCLFALEREEPGEHHPPLYSVVDAHVQREDAHEQKECLRSQRHRRS